MWTLFEVARDVNLKAQTKIYNIIYNFPVECGTPLQNDMFEELSNYGKNVRRKKKSDNKN